jgi:predicted nucleotidyltransferase
VGGSGGGSGYRLNPSDVDRLREQAQARLERSRLDADVNSFLQSELVEINDRDVDLITRRLEDIQQGLEGDIEEFDRLLFGGSVAKHTYVDGLSDVDSLVVLDPAKAGGPSPEEMRNQLRDLLQSRLNMGEVDSIQVGRMAVTVRYRDGNAIQLLPAVQRGDSLAISSSSGDTWSSINPRYFADRLARANRRQGGAIVPTIKLAKSIIANVIPEAARPSGYHVEALALVTFADYDGPRSPKAMVQHFFEAASSSVLRPIRDVTGQSNYLDSGLGPANSEQRQSLARRFTRISRAMKNASSVSDWQALVES